MSRDADRPEWDRIGGERVREDLGAREVDAGDRRTHPLRAGLPPRRHAAEAVARVVSARDDAELSIRQPAPARSAALPGHEAVGRRAPEGLVQPRPVHLDRLPSNALVHLAITSQSRLPMHQDVGRLTEHPAFHSPREVSSGESVAPTNSSPARDSLDSASSHPPPRWACARTHVRPNWVLSRSYPPLTTCKQPCLGHSSGSPDGSPATSVSLVLLASSHLSPAGSTSAPYSILLFIRASSPSLSWSKRRRAGSPDAYIRTCLTANPEHLNRWPLGRLRCEQPSPIVRRRTS